MSNKVILPGSTIGILGGGQLGRMISLAGRAMGYRFVVLDPTEDSPCGQVADGQITAQYNNEKAAQQLAEQADVITYEFENVDANVAEMLCSTSYVPQGSELLHTTQHRIREKKAIEAAGAQVAPYREIADVEDLHKGLDELGLPCVLKTATGGYDGKGQWVIRDKREAIAAFETLQQAKTDLVLEKFIRFDKEISVIAARTPSGEIETFPVAENIHVENILHKSIVPARISREIDKKAQELAKKIAASLNAVGIIAVEMFLTKDGEIYINEMAPRPHNSGHYTMEACSTSQFEQHVRAVCDLKLGRPELLKPVVMVNILGEHVEPLLQWLAKKEQPAGLEIKVHLYGKKEAKHKRKMGHLNILCNDVEDALDWIEKSGIWEMKIEM